MPVHLYKKNTSDVLNVQVMSNGTAISSEDIVAALQKLHSAFTGTGKLR
jgi:hypothetical protein